MFGFIIFTFFVVGGVWLMLELQGTHLGSPSSNAFTSHPKFAEFNNTFNIEGNLDNEIGRLQDATNTSTTNWGPLGVLNSLIGTVWNSLRLMFSAVTTMTGVFTAGLTVFGIPAWVGGMMLMMITILVVFGIYTVVFQKEV